MYVLHVGVGGLQSAEMEEVRTTCDYLVTLSNATDLFKNEID